MSSTSRATAWPGCLRPSTGSRRRPGPPTTRTMSKYYPDFSGPFEALLAAVAGRSVAVIGHARPDGDCIGSQVALARVLEARGSPAVCVNPDTVPRRLAYIARGMRFIRTDEALLLPQDVASVFV